MRYVLIDERRNDVFTKEFDSLVGVIHQGNIDWSYLTDYEKRHKVEAFYAIRSADEDEGGERHLDGDFVSIWKFPGQKPCVPFED